MAAAALRSAVLACLGRAAFGELQPSEPWVPKLLKRKLDIDRPAFMMFDEEMDAVFVTQFGVTNKFLPLPAPSKVSFLPASGLKAALSADDGSFAALKPEIFIGESGGLLWPNKISRHGDFFVIADGFLVPGKSDGNIFLTAAHNLPQTAAGELHQITEAKKSHFYQMLEWHDFNGDGEEDILTARCIQGGGMPPQFSGELVILTNPGKDKMLTQPWKEQVVSEGPDVIFATEAHGDGLAVFSAEFFAEKLTVRLLSKEGAVVGSPRIIEDDIGRVFSVEIVDLNGDGNEDLLVTNHVSNEKVSGVFAYELPPRGADGTRDLARGAFKKHVLTTGFKTKFSLLPGAASPGFAYAFRPKVGASGPQHILVEGDGSHEVVLLSPQPSVGPFAYNRTLVEDVGGTLGSLMIRDFTGDGIVDVLAADNDDFTLSAFTFETHGTAPSSIIAI